MKPQQLDNGFLVIFEGIDGSGKTTQLHLARDELQKHGWASLYTTRNLGGTPIGEALRGVIKSPLERPATTDLYISVAIQEALTAHIKQERDKQQLILMDRGPLSLAAYAVYGGGVDETLGWQHVDAGMAALQPELVILYKTDVATALARLKSKDSQTDYFESKPESYFEKVDQGYDAAAKRYPDQIIVINGNQPIDAVHRQTMQAIVNALTKN